MGINVHACMQVTYGPAWDRINGLRLKPNEDEL